MTASTQKFEQFDIRNFMDRIVPAKQKGRYICPVCGGDNLTINLETGAYNCWSGCERKLIRDAIAPLDGKQVKIVPFKTRLNKKTKLPPPPPPGDFSLVKTLTSITEKPQPVAGYDGKVGSCEKITYTYSASQWVERIQYLDASKPKGYDKYFQQYHLSVEGETDKKGNPIKPGTLIPTKGDAPWTAYRIEAIIESLKAHQDGTPVLLHLEGEGNIWFGIEAGIEACTHQGSEWKPVSIAATMELLREYGLIHLLITDNDKTGRAKGKTFIEACTKANVPGLVVASESLDPDICEGGDIQQLLEKMGADRLIELLNQQIKEYVERYDFATTEDEDEGEDESGKKIDYPTLSQKAVESLYRDTRWICVDKKLYKWNDTYYKHSPDNIEIARITAWCNNFKVVKKIENRMGDVIGEKITYPYADPGSVRTVFTWVKMLLGGIPREQINPPGMNCTNGVLRINWTGSTPSWEIIPHDPDIIYLYEPLIKFDPTANPEHSNRLLECLRTGQREIFLRTIAAGLSLKQVRRYKGRLVRGLLMNGDGANGKDSLREVVSLSFGREGMTDATVTDFKIYDEGRKFPLAKLKHSRINWSSENGAGIKLDNIQSLKAFITGDTLSYERKGQDEDTFIPEAIALFNVNGVPNIQASLAAIKSRLAVLDFPFTYAINPGEGELLADPRFKYDPEFLINEVAPAFLNRILQALLDLMRDGIDYSCTDEAMENIQINNSHLFQFCKDSGLQYGANESYLTAQQIWEKLKPWYIENGTLTIDELPNGKEKLTWTDQVKQSDKNIKAPNQVIARFEYLFPKAKRKSIRGSGKNYTQVLCGLEFSPTGGSGDGDWGGEFDPKPKPPTTPPQASTPSYPVESSSYPVSYPITNPETIEKSSFSYPSYPSYPISEDTEKNSSSNNDPGNEILDLENSEKKQYLPQIGQDDQDAQETNDKSILSDNATGQDIGQDKPSIGQDEPQILPTATDNIQNLEQPQEPDITHLCQELIAVSNETDLLRLIEQYGRRALNEAGKVLKENNREAHKATNAILKSLKATLGDDFQTLPA